MPDLPPLLKAALQLRAETDLSRLFLPAMSTSNRPPLSPAAQAVLDAYLKAPCDNRLPVAAALRAAADQVVPQQQKANKDDALIDSLHLSTRTENALKRCKVFTIGDLRYFTFSDLLLIKGFGVASADEVVTSLASIGISLPDSAHARKLSWSDVTARNAIRRKLLAIAAELDPQP